ncbi:hypothetical protein Bca4012_004482 [Brassica carinata]
MTLYHTPLWSANTAHYITSTTPPYISPQSTTHRPHHTRVHNSPVHISPIYNSHVHVSPLHNSPDTTPSTKIMSS